MKAYSLFSVNDLRYVDVNPPTLTKGWALVRVKAAGICSSDIPRIFVKGTYHFPTIPGHEFSGVVEDVYSSEDNKWIGKRVGVFPLIPCKNCISCLNGQYEMCSDYDYLGSRRDGGFAELVAVPIWNLIELPDSISFETAAMLEPLSVALHAVKQSALSLGDRVAVVGTGMIAFAAAQWANKITNNIVYVLGRNKNKESIASKINGVKYLLEKEVTEEFDVVIEAVGTNAAITRAINLVRPGGSLVLMGNPEGEITFSQQTYWRILRKQIHVVGTWNSAYESGRECDWSYAIDSLKNHDIMVDDLITHRFDQDHLPDGLRVMLDHKEPYCKIMTIWNK